MRASPLESRVAEIVSPVVIDMGLDLVCVKIVGDGGSRNVQIMAEDPQTRRLDIDKCAALSKAVSALLDVEDPIQGAYRLEVSSPGIDRPLVKLADFETYKGFEAKLETDMPNANGQRRFKGVLKGVKEENITLETEQGLEEIPFAALVKAKLVLSNDLINAGKNKFDSTTKR